VYGDVLDFFREARLVFVDKTGVPRSKRRTKISKIFLIEGLEWISIRAFIRVQWEPFEAKFGSIDRSLQAHLKDLHDAASVAGLAEISLLSKLVSDRSRNGR
jgi:hypothetical protein